MNAAADINWEKIILLLKDILHQKGPVKNLPEIQSSYPALAPLLEELVKLRDFSHSLANGDLHRSLDARGYYAGALKSLQSNLRHLTWQAGMVARGDYAQRVDFMGEFSVSFNCMIQKLKEAAEQEHKYRLLAENTAEVIWLLDTEMRLQYISPSIGRLMGYAQSDLEGRQLSELPLPFIHAAFPRGEVSDLLADNQFISKTIELSQPGCKGKMIWTETSITIISDPSDQFLRFLGVTRDISERKVAETLLQHSYERKQRNDFFNRLVTSPAAVGENMQQLANLNRRWIPDNFSLYFLDTTDFNGANAAAQETGTLDKAQQIDALIDYLNRKENLIVWELPDTGVGVIETRTGPVKKQIELASAKEHLDYLRAYQLNLALTIGIADYEPGWTEFASRLAHARTAAKVAMGIELPKPICHYDDCGIFQALAPFAASDESEKYIEKTLGPLIQYDLGHGTELVVTLEKLLAGSSAAEIAAELFCHQKTIQLRKHRIEQLLDVTLDKPENRMSLSAAFQLCKFKNVEFAGKVRQNPL